MVKHNQHMLPLQAVPGIGLLTATTTDNSGLHSGQQFAARLGLTPRQSGTGVKIRQMGIFKRGYPYVQTLLMHRPKIIMRGCSEQAVDHCTARPQALQCCGRGLGLGQQTGVTYWAVLIKGKAFEQLK